MAGLSFAAALAANFEGQKLNADLDLTKAEAKDKQAQAQLRQMQAAAMQKRTKDEAELGQWIQTQQAAETQPIQDSAQQIKMWQGAEAKALGQGNFEGARRMSEMAAAAADRSKQLFMEQQKEQQAKKETLAEVASEYISSPTPENTLALGKAAVAAGVDPSKIPKDVNSPAFAAWAKNQQMASMSGKERVAALEKGREFDQKEDERKKEFEERQADRREARAQTAAIQAGNLALREQGLELRKQLLESTERDRADKVTDAKKNSSFRQSRELNQDLQKQADPMLRDRRLGEDVLGLLRVDSPVADNQISQSLTSLLGEMKGRATNVYYKDNKNFGSAMGRIEGFVTRGLTGRYTESERKEIYEMVTGMQKMTIDPALRNLEKDQKRRAEKFDLDPENIKIQGDFERSSQDSSPGGGRGATSPSLPTTPKPVLTANDAPDGSTATGPNGARMIRKDGKWQPM